ncbi:MAG: NTP transferase domain-containing protein [Alcanivoracaceae bacterium]|nr:NTP transferase domain-containing protein [Alcanivoracaceae bacterium]
MHEKYKQTAVIILAGGRSNRAEVTKGLRTINQKYWIDLQINYFSELGFKYIFVGLGHESKKYINSSTFLKNPPKHLKYFINDNPHKGSFSTLKHVLIQATKFNWKHTLIIHIDHALPESTVLSILINQANFDVVKPCFDGVSGHPIKISQSYCLNLCKKSDASQLDREIRKLDINQICWLEVESNNIHYNFNTEPDWSFYVENIF